MSLVWARSPGPKSELNPTTTSSKSISTYRISTPFVVPARLRLLNRMISRSRDCVKEASDPVNCRAEAW
jgi:hypothetical protein